MTSPTYSRASCRCSSESSCFVSFLLLMAVFRSLGIPLTAAIMNLLSAGAAFGVVTAVFQIGWGAPLLGVGTTGPDRGVPTGADVPDPVRTVDGLRGVPGQPHLRGVAPARWTTETAVAHGLAATGRTITAAAAIMVLVFGAFVLGGSGSSSCSGSDSPAPCCSTRSMIRSVLVPALMLVLGDANWRLPRGSTACCRTQESRAPRSSPTKPAARAPHKPLPAAPEPAHTTPCPQPKGPCHEYPARARRALRPNPDRPRPRRVRRALGRPVHQSQPIRATRQTGLGRRLRGLPQRLRGLSSGGRRRGRGRPNRRRALHLPRTPHGHVHGHPAEWRADRDALDRHLADPRRPPARALGRARHARAFQQIGAIPTDT